MEKKNVVIYVAGQRFSIATSDPEEYVIGIGEKVDVMIKGISKDNPRLNRDACAILTALNFCDDETKLRQMMEVLREQVKEYINTSDALRTENAKLKEELEALKNAAPAKEVAEDPVSAIQDKEEDRPFEVNVSVPAKSEAIVAAATTEHRHTAFVGKDFKSDRHKNKKNKHKLQKQSFTEAPAPAVAVKNTPADFDEAQAESASPYHQFSIFDDLP